MPAPPVGGDHVPGPVVFALLPQVAADVARFGMFAGDPDMELPVVEIEASRAHRLRQEAGGSRRPAMTLDPGQVDIRL